jgi:hypothetical protein
MACSTLCSEHIEVSLSDVGDTAQRDLELGVREVPVQMSPNDWTRAIRPSSCLRGGRASVERKQTYTVVTTARSVFAARFHARMPRVLELEDVEA